MSNQTPNLKIDHVIPLASSQCPQVHNGATGAIEDNAGVAAAVVSTRRLTRLSREPATSLTRTKLRKGFIAGFNKVVILKEARADW